MVSFSNYRFYLPGCENGRLCSPGMPPMKGGGAASRPFSAANVAIIHSDMQQKQFFLITSARKNKYVNITSFFI